MYLNPIIVILIHSAFVSGGARAQHHICHALDIDEMDTTDTTAPFWLSRTYLGNLQDLLFEMKGLALRNHQRQ